MTSPTSFSTDPRSDRATKQAIEQEKAAVENTSQGYGHSAKAAHISAKPDGDTQGGPGADNDDMTRPDSPEGKPRR